MNECLVLARSALGLQGLTIDGHGMRADQDVSHQARLGSVIDPVVNGSSLDQYVSRVEPYSFCVEFQLD